MPPRKQSEGQKRQKREEIEACLRWIERQPVGEPFQHHSVPSTGTGTGTGTGAGSMLPSLTTQTPPMPTFVAGTQYVPHGLASSNDESGSSAGHSEGSPGATAPAAPPQQQHRVKRLMTHLAPPPAATTAAPASTSFNTAAANTSASTPGPAPDAPLLTEDEARLQVSRLFVLGLDTYRSHRALEAGSLAAGSAAASAFPSTEPPCSSSPASAAAPAAPAAPAPAAAADATPATAGAAPSSYPAVAAALLRELDAAALARLRPVLSLRGDAFFRHMHVGRVGAILGVSECVEGGGVGRGSQQSAPGGLVGE